MIYITGDTHGRFRRFGQKYFPATAEDYLIICGDFGGVWDDSKEERYWLDWLDDRPFKTLFVSGNHENFELLAELPVKEWNGGKVQFVRDNVIHLMRGQVFEIEGSTFFTMGGATSHDIKDGILEPDDPDFKNKVKRLCDIGGMFRINHFTWWKQELPSAEEYAEAEKNLDARNRKVDYIITHCAPTSVEDILGKGFFGKDKLTDYLETVRQTCKFRTWFFGHYHASKMLNEQMVLIYNDIICYDSLMYADVRLDCEMYYDPIQESYNIKNH